MLLKKLCETNGVSGDEGRVRRLIMDEIKPFADEIIVDSIGNIIALKKGECSDKKVMLSAHMDEIGFIIKGITDKGYLQFETVGGIDTRVIISKKVKIGEKEVPGIIGMKAIHLQKKEERETVPEIKNLYIDIGAKNKEDAEKKVELGDYAAFDTGYQEFGNGKIKAKALDDRIGCMVLIEALKHKCKYDLYVCFLAQEEVGLRGAQIASYRIKPDIALVLESTTCSDVFRSKEHEYSTVLGQGVAVTFMDRSTIVERQYSKWLYDTAQKANIPVQYKKTTMGGNDAGAIHICGEGIKTGVLSVPCRYLHSPAGVVSKSDIKAMQDLTILFIDRIEELVQ
ncbi:MAG: M42 family metallopeptidase [Clostridia bacterium]|nr:M42 family metallopeptidase [Clostridia bacterium]